MRARNLLLAIILFLLPLSAAAQPAFDFSHFKMLPVVHDGRVKPLGRMAQLLLRQISDINVSAEAATPWLAQLLFDPQQADTPEIFYIADQNLRFVLELPERKTPYYSFAELNRAFVQHAALILDLRRTDAAKLSANQQDLLTLYARVTYYEQLKGAMTLFLPLRAHQDQSFVQLWPGDKKLRQALLAIGQNNQSLRIIHNTHGWQSPWEVFLDNPEHPPAVMQQWQQAANAYIQGDNAVWQKSIAQIYQQSVTGMLDIQLRTELLYARFQPYFYSMILYALGGIVALTWRRQPLAGLLLCLGGFVLHALGLACRMVILHRPPVSDLYESVLFVGLLLMALGLGFIGKRRDFHLLGPLALVGAGLHLCGFGLNNEEDNLKVLQAVLDTKFWLATHVLIITGGYALCLLTSVAAHAGLVQSLRQKTELSRTKTFRGAYRLSLVSLLLICTGTLLGGVWADQSWGRFWGWDPKENGALLIGLWLVWLLHGKYSRDISDFWFMTGLAALSLVVSISWIGINLLGIGLHSYGFISGSAGGLLIILLLETIFLMWCLHKRRHHA